MQINMVREKFTRSPGSIWIFGLHPDWQYQERNALSEKSSLEREYNKVVKAAGGEGRRVWFNPRLD